MNILKLTDGNPVKYSESRLRRDNPDTLFPDVLTDEITDRETGRSRGFGFVEMEDGSEAAIEALNGVDFKGRALRVNEAQSKQRPGGGGGGRF